MQNSEIGNRNQDENAVDSDFRFPSSDIRYGAIAQLGERLNGIQEVSGSIPLGSTSLRPLRGLRLGKPADCMHAVGGGCHAEARSAKADG